MRQRRRRLGQALCCNHCPESVAVATRLGVGYSRFPLEQWSDFTQIVKS